MDPEKLTEMHSFGWQSAIFFLLLFFVGYGLKYGFKKSTTTSIMLVGERITSFLLTYIVAWEILIRFGWLKGLFAMTFIYVFVGLVLIKLYDAYKISFLSESKPLPSWKWFRKIKVIPLVVWKKNHKYSYFLFRHVLQLKLRKTIKNLSIAALGIHSTFLTVLYFRKDQKDKFSYEEMPVSQRIAVIGGSAIGCSLFTFILLFGTAKLAIILHIY